MYVPYIHIYVHTCTAAETSYVLVCFKMTNFKGKVSNVKQYLHHYRRADKSLARPD